MLALFSCLNWDSENSVQVGQDEGGWHTGGLCSDWHRVKPQLLYQRNRLFWFCGHVSYWKF